MAMVASNMSDHIQKQLTRSLERILEEAHLSGELKLSNRKLKDFPKVGKGNAKFNLQDTVIADLSKNRFTELPDEVTEFPFLEKLHLYHNAIRIIPETVAMLQSLSYLDLSRNQLTALPREVCRLPLQTLLVAHNRLSSLPDELGRMSALAELDAGCNEISSLPPRIGDLPRLRCLDLRSNLLVQLPIELTYLRLVKLDISGNRISVLPNELRKMKSLDDLRISDNPLTSPPASLCVRGRTHVFKYLERQAAKHERARAGRQARRGPLDGRGHVTLDTRSHKRHNVDSGYSTSDGVSEKRWSQEIHSAAMLLHDQLEKRRLERSASENGVESRRPVISCMRGSIPVVPSGQLESAGLSQQQQRQVQQDPTTLPVQFPQTVANPTPMIANGEDKRPLNHIQTYREYKEALRQQRANEGPSVYRSRDQMTPPGNEPPGDRTDCVGILGKSSANDESANRRPVQKVTPSRANYRSIPIVNGSGGEHNGQLVDQPYKKPSSPVKSHSPTSLAHPTSAIARTSSSFTEGNESPSRNGGSPKSAGRSVTWHSSLPEKYSFTMRREFERAKEEADLIEQLRNNIETRLKMALPEDLAPALTDGVVLCHLANHVRPRSVGSIHVPSPAVPKLTMARCRRNVDNFLEACRKIGVDEEVLMDADAIMDVGYMDAHGLAALARLVGVLLREDEGQEEPSAGSPAILTVQDRVLSTTLLVVFVSILTLLYLFPLPDY
ncbi:leucine-rich repeat and calponin homology domain-containing protein 1 isoform X3 [Orussus abietinus]|uniref:leucine-rich repeat and calponin homology domain-containing protein 1 isoform X3 n=1 Tax=Orussus abietinus TaxID=222816 RepID=UPI000626DC93|nr:leucine-rich repeat and calponin homology domain-containing protein 1 isoform X3 [Orussus abietinus]